MVWLPLLVNAYATICRLRSENLGFWIDKSCVSATIIQSTTHLLLIYPELKYHTPTVANTLPKQTIFTFILDQGTTHLAITHLLQAKAQHMLSLFTCAQRQNTTHVANTHPHQTKVHISSSYIPTPNRSTTHVAINRTHLQQAEVSHTFYTPEPKYHTPGQYTLAKRKWWKITKPKLNNFL